MNLSALHLLIYAMIGAIVCILGLFIRSCLQDYIGISSNLGIESDTELHRILYRCKQQYQFIGKYGLVTPPEFFTLEKYLVQCKQNRMMDACSSVALIADKLTSSSSFQESLKPIYRLVYRILQKLFFPMRSEINGPIESDLHSSRLVLAQILLRFTAPVTPEPENKR